MHTNKKIALLLVLILNTSASAFNFDSVSSFFSNNTKRYLAIDHFGTTVRDATALICESYATSDDIAPIVKEFVIEQCTLVDLPNPEQIKIKIGGHPKHLYLAGMQTIYITEPYYDEIKKYLELKATYEQNGTIDTQEYKQTVLVVNMHAGLIQHEANHIKNHDIVHCMAVTLIASCGAELAYQLYMHANNNEQNGLFIDPAQKSWTHNIVSCLTKTAIIKTVRTLYMRHNEQNADNGIQNNIDILSAVKQLFSNLHEQSRNQIKWTMGKQILHCYDTYPALFNLQDLTHPSHLARAQKFEERLQDLQSS